MRDGKRMNVPNRTHGSRSPRPTRPPLLTRVGQSDCPSRWTVRFLGERTPHFRSNLAVFSSPRPSPVHLASLWVTVPFGSCWADSLVLLELSEFNVSPGGQSALLCVMVHTRCNAPSTPQLARGSAYWSPDLTVPFVGGRRTPQSVAGGQSLVLAVLSAVVASPRVVRSLKLWCVAHVGTPLVRSGRHPDQVVTSEPR
ncbi:hypothetical protein SAMN05444342_4208 [Haladaptatus paucihalophilus DX253]|uniref:Uncharacterized protein n=1 Tax=Haladaptatus paucihalophilus DX253 TaxID=797209 RepID=A0A1M7BXS4_HALPU|nr:hypothetical protein SAMN05444342_4208 [Haladaptatus paucihalophilus DX253]